MERLQQGPTQPPPSLPRRASHAGVCAQCCTRSLARRIRSAATAPRRSGWRVTSAATSRPRRHSTPTPSRTRCARFQLSVFEYLRAWLVLSMCDGWAGGGGGCWGRAGAEQEQARGVASRRGARAVCCGVNEWHRLFFKSLYIFAFGLSTTGVSGASRSSSMKLLDTTTVPVSLILLTKTIRPPPSSHISVLSVCPGSTGDANRTL